jgi:hypothetical protein
MNFSLENSELQQTRSSENLKSLRVFELLKSGTVEQRNLYLDIMNGLKKVDKYLTAELFDSLSRNSFSKAMTVSKSKSQPKPKLRLKTEIVNRSKTHAGARPKLESGSNSESKSLQTPDPQNVPADFIKQLKETNCDDLSKFFVFPDQFEYVTSNFQLKPESERWSDEIYREACIFIVEHHVDLYDLLLRFRKSQTTGLSCLFRFGPNTFSLNKMNIIKELFNCLRNKRIVETFSISDNQLTVTFENSQGKLFIESGWLEKYCEIAVIQVGLNLFSHFPGSNTRWTGMPSVIVKGASDTIIREFDYFLNIGKRNFSFECKIGTDVRSGQLKDYVVIANWALGIKDMHQIFYLSSTASNQLCTSRTERYKCSFVNLANFHKVLERVITETLEKNYIVNKNQNLDSRSKEDFEYARPYLDTDNPGVSEVWSDGIRDFTFKLPKEVNGQTSKSN